MFNATLASEARLAEFHRRFILFDIVTWVPDRVKATLLRTFENFPWKVTIFDNLKYLILALTLDWAQSLTRRGILRLDGVKFPIIPWELWFSEG